MSQRESSASRFVCIHGHFYQPPRENPWLEAVELQESAHPFHDWNQRINAECYAPNACSRILDGQDRITRIVNNYERISFNVGPTLLSWMEAHDPESYTAILAADRASAERYSGHGSAMAQVYSHAILPLCNARDQLTQVLWGIGDFRFRFGRRPEGMWLPETAADLPSLEVLAALGIRFTVLAPEQAAAVRLLDGAAGWEDVSGGRIDPRRSYLLRLPSGKSISLFFYDGPVSRAVAFERLLVRGSQLARRLVGTFVDDRSEAQLVHIATDGETYGHHHAFGDMALAYALHHVESNGLARLTNYAEFLERFPPTHEVRIRENSSWSCVHGLGRWTDNCGCHSGSHGGWSQAWRKPLREALDWLRDRMMPLFERHASRHLRDPWAARDDYIDVILDRSEESLQRFFERHATHRPGAAETTKLLKLLELQRHAMLMYTSCGWFFDELSGIETLQILQYAARVLQLAQELFEEDCTEGFLKLLQKAPSNIPEHGNGRRLFETKIIPLRVDLSRVAANHAASRLFGESDVAPVSSAFNVEFCDLQRLESGAARMLMGHMEARSRITLERADLAFAFVHPGNPELRGRVAPFRDEAAYRSMLVELTGAFSRNDQEQLACLLERHLPGAPASLQTLFRDERRRILDRMLESTLKDVEAAYGELYQHHASLMQTIAGLDAAPPRALRIAAELVLNNSLRRELENPEFDPRTAQRLLQDVRAGGVALDKSALAYAARGTMARLLERLELRPGDETLLERIGAAAVLVRALPFVVDLREAENRYYRLLGNVYPQYRERASNGDEQARRWVESFATLGDTLRVALE